MIARENGTYAMVAMDQRESLRTMFREHGFDDSDERVRAFKTAVARELAPHASGFLIEPEFVEDVRQHVPRGLIMAVDLLTQATEAAGARTVRQTPLQPAEVARPDAAERLADVVEGAAKPR